MTTSSSRMHILLLMRMEYDREIMFPTLFVMSFIQQHSKTILQST